MARVTFLRDDGDAGFLTNQIPNKIKLLIGRENKQALQGQNANEPNLPNTTCLPPIRTQRSFNLKGQALAACG